MTFHDRDSKAKAIATVGLLVGLMSAGYHQMSPVVYDHLCQKAEAHYRAVEPNRTPSAAIRSEPGIDHSKEPLACRAIEAVGEAEERHRQAGGVTDEEKFLAEELVRRQQDDVRENLRRGGAGGSGRRGRGPDDAPDLARIADARAKQQVAAQRREPQDRRLDRGDSQRRR